MTLADELERLEKLKTPETLHATGSNSVVTEGNDWSVIFAPGEHIKSRHHAALAALMFNNLPAIIAALREQEWQPIETAPKGLGQLILGHAEQRWIRFGRYYPEFRKWYYSGTNERQQYSETEGGVPTHWRPIPTLPRSGDAQ